MRNLTALLAGLIFGIGLLLSGMTNPSKVLAFLDLAGAWDPSLLLVMAGAIGVAAAPLAWAKTRSRSLLGAPLFSSLTGPSDNAASRPMIRSSRPGLQAFGLLPFP